MERQFIDKIRSVSIEGRAKGQIRIRLLQKWLR